MDNAFLNREKVYSEIASLCEKNSLPHAVLIECESRAEGEELARFTASCLLCTGEQPPCGNCSACRKMSAGGHPDLFETDGIKGKSRSFSVDAVREIRANAFVVPNESDKKVFILKNGENMNEQAQNAILKILEEPPRYVYFIIVTLSKSTMLETVLSRVSVYTLSCGENEAGEEETEAMKAFVKAFLEPNELGLMEAAAVFQRNNALARDTLNLLSSVFRDALVKKSGFTGDFRFKEESSALCSALTASALLNCVEVCSELLASIDRNCNNNLLITRMCYEFKRASGR